uniref:E2 ubiquitin-conjugating enzyme n=1 Tax=Ditylum brightwellii TaxID=49249 RepID=A0A6U3VBD1_9STRA|mmetsp:Transcript_770/g.968  ORF Transcript_770/g.968 Transcript_770/m.968 type:complete len:219 (+) Transcript_770:327-983(+)
MANDMCVRRLTRELQSLQKNPLHSPRIMAMPNEENILEWHYVIEGNTGTPYEGGHYHGKLIFPKEYPLKPPSVIMLTPSGRFKPNRRLCLSMSDFHPESWNPMWSVSTILTGLYSFMVETGPTLGSIETTTAQKRKFARQSLDFNVRDSNFCKLFPDLVDLHKERMAERRRLNGGKEPSIQNISVTSPKADEDQMQGILATAAGIVALISVLFAMRFF